MMRRRLPAVAAVWAHPAVGRAQSSRGGGGGGGSGGDIHKFLRRNAPPHSGTGSGGSVKDGEIRSSFPGGETPSASRGGQHQRQYRQQQQPVPTAGGGGAATVGTMDWATQLQRELFSAFDPLGGLVHKDFYRDPATGYSPQYAPRNFAQGGEIAYTHAAASAQHYADAAAQRTWHDHDVAQMEHIAQQAGAQASQLTSAAERAQYLDRFTPSDRFASLVGENADLRVHAQLQNMGPTSGERRRQQMLVDRYQAAAAAAASPSTAASGDTHATLAAAGTSVPLASALSATELRQRLQQRGEAAHDDAVEEHLRLEHGLRAKERYDFTIMQRSARVPFEGYDRDRFLAQSMGTPFAATQLPPGMQPSSMQEAQQRLRGGGDGGDSPAIPPTESYVRRAFARNTVTDKPLLDEALTQSVLDGLRAREEAATRAAEQRRRQRFGLGRQGPLVQDAGPDKRTLRKHTNDERLMHAAAFKRGAYRHHLTDEHINPYVRGETTQGVGHLLTNRFDVARREDRVSRGEQDLTERRQIHLGTPILQTTDEFVLHHRNARGERPLDYFKPFPDFRAHRLNHMYSDTEGFSLMKQRPEFLEWELFVRYRAHHQQRRELAQQHGLEPVANESAQERDARRLALDELCERTPFDPSRIPVNDDEMPVDAETLRAWFGVYLLPSPTIVDAVTGAAGTGSALGLHLQHLNDAMGTEDRREHLLSSRYINQLLLVPGFAHRIGRGFVEDTFGRAPEPVIKYAQPPEVLRQFTAEEQRMYQAYVKGETDRQLDEWARVWQGRRYILEREQYGEVVQSPSGAVHTPVQVVDVQRDDTGAVLTIATAKFASELEAATAAVQASQAGREPSETTVSGSSSSGGGYAGSLTIDGAAYTVVKGTQRRVTPLTVRLDSGEMVETTDEIYTTYPLEVDASAAQHHHLNYGIGTYHYNRGNYVETQDALWERATAEGVEGWSPATHVDGLRPGLPVRARRTLSAPSTSKDANGGGGTAAADAASRAVSGDFQRGRIIAYLHQPFFNPEPRTVTVAFASDGAVEAVPLADVLIWQRQHYGPDRTRGDESRRYQPQGLRRYVDVADPHKLKQANHMNSNGSAAVQGSGLHFLDKYEPTADTQATERLHTTKQITEIDSWTSYDSRRAENHRPLSISHRRDYIRQGYMHRYTPWEWIAVQEADQPIIRETMRSDDMGSSYFFSLNRYWRYKARPHGYIRNYDNEVRDLFQFIDGITPWKQAQKIRTYWEVRRHHPMPQFNRPEVAMHRNAAGLLPAHLWETDKKTGKVKAVKDSVRDYQTKTPVPKWVQL